jgi:carboxypeptidase C (cathepsin A)
MLILLLCVANSAKLSDLVINLPGLPDVPNFDMYSGYLDVPNSLGKSLHYVFVESQNNPKTDPLLLWLNGGPGCSSMDGFVYENGPYVFAGDGATLERNVYSWNNNASVLYLETPAGVGFSILGDVSNNYTTDQITAHDNLQALLVWFKEFPEYRDHDFYISGESYAGIYVPTLAYQIVMYNAYTIRNYINLKGMAVGNGVTDYTYDNDGAIIIQLYTHGFLSYGIYQQALDYCDQLTDFTSTQCQNLLNYVYNELLVNLNIYDLYGVCYYHDDERSYMDNQKRFKFLLKNKPYLKDIPPCASWVGAYSFFYNSSVRAALNIPASVPPWQFCVDLDYNPDEVHGSVFTYEYLIRYGLRILVYSGDTDAAVPFTGTREWIGKLGLPVVTPYHSWLYNEQVAGYAIQYRGLTFVTVKGAGHIVPQLKRPQALVMINAFLQGVSL